MSNRFSKLIISGLIISVTITACKPDLKTPAPDKGSIDVSKYVSIGNSITSGYADGALYYDGQMVSYPNLLATQFKLVGGGEFKQPMVAMGSVGLGSSANSRYTLGYKTDCMGASALAPVYSTGDFNVLANISAQGPFNNMGVPGAKSFHVPYAGYGLLNPFFGRMTANAYTASILVEAASQKPTFFSLFIGNNDVLSYALAGGASDSITQLPVFNASIDAIIAAMTANSAKGIVGSIPDVTSLPYFTTVPYNGLTLSASQAAALNVAYSSLGITFSAGSNAFMIKDNNAAGGIRQIRSNELVLLSVPQDSLKCAGWGSAKPIPDQYVLTSTEIGNIQSATISFNNKLRSTADAKGLAYVDVNAFMASTKNGITYDGVTVSTTFVSGGAFSLDGIHLTPRGNALLANEFIKAINARYSASIPQIDVGKYRGVIFP